MPIQPKSDTANRPDPPPCEHDRPANKVAHKSTHDLHENLRQKSGATRSIYVSRKRAMVHNQHRILQPSEHYGASQYRGAAHPLCFTDEVLDHEFPEGFKPVNIEAYDGTTDPGVWIEDFILHIHMARGDDLHAIKYLPLKLKVPARHWLKSLPENSIGSWEELEDAFRGQFSRDLCPTSGCRRFKSYNPTIRRVRPKALEQVPHQEEPNSRLSGRRSLSSF